MADEPVMIEVTAGPYRGQRLSVTKAQADKAVAEQWAFDLAKARPEASAELTDADRARIADAAVAGAAELRGETLAAKSETRDMTAEQPTGYKTKELGKK